MPMVFFNACDLRLGLFGGSHSGSMQHSASVGEAALNTSYSGPFFLVKYIYRVQYELLGYFLLRGFVENNCRVDPPNCQT